MTAGTPPGGSTADDGPAPRPRFPQQPLPTAQSVLWRPAIQELARPDGDASPIFVAQHALLAVEDHLRSAPHQALLGFLFGRVLEAPDSGQPYVVVHGAVRVPQMIVNGATERVVAQSLAAAQRVMPPEDGVVVGWYRSDPSGELKLTAHDHTAHVQHFQRPWQVAMLVTIGPPATRGGFFRPAGDPGSPVPYLAFYELLGAESYRDGWKQPRVSWANYWSPDPAVWHTGADEPRAPRVTPSGRPSGARRLAPLVMSDDDEAWRRPPFNRGAWLWWVVAGAAVAGAVALGIRLGLAPAEPVAAGDTSSVRAADTTATAAVRRAIEAYRLRASLFGSGQMTCADLASGLADVDEEWLHYTLASPHAAAAEDTTVATPPGSLAADVDEVEADFERSGCARP